MIFSFLEGENVSMSNMDSTAFRARLSDRLADSLTAPIPAGTARRIYGRVTLPGKATAVVGMRRAGKTTFLHQLRRERLERDRERELRALADAGRRYPKATKRLLTLTRDSLPSSVPSDIVAQPAYEWLLAAPGED